LSIKLFFEAICKYLLGFLIVFVLIFLPCGTLNYFYGWLFMCLLFVPMFFGGIVLMIFNPKLLALRLNGRERHQDQKELITISGLMFFIGFIVAGLNFHFKWIVLDDIWVIISSIIFIISYIMYAFVLKENTFLARTIEIVDNQEVIDKGLYSIVRHPMYMVTIFMFLTIPLILNSLISFFIFLIYPFVIVKRIKGEEKLLLKQLKGYDDYCKKVKYKLIPYIY